MELSLVDATPELIDAAIDDQVLLGRLLDARVALPHTGETGLLDLPSRATVGRVDVDDERRALGAETQVHGPSSSSSRRAYRIGRVT